MSREYNPDPWNKSGKYIDRTYASGVAQERPKLTTRIHCEPEPEELARTAALSGPAHEQEMKRIEENKGMYDADKIETETQWEWFCRELRSGHGFRNAGEAAEEIRSIPRRLKIE